MRKWIWIAALLAAAVGAEAAGSQREEHHAGAREWVAHWQLVILAGTGTRLTLKDPGPLRYERREHCLHATKGLGYGVEESALSGWKGIRFVGMCVPVGKG